ncbi:MAG: hypothetical protein ACRCX2_19435 [Paraclostridium sp.]
MDYRNFDMIYNNKMFANKELLYAHIFENRMLNNRGEEFGTTLIFTKDRNNMWDVLEGLRKVRGITVKDNRNGHKDSSIEYQYYIPRTNKISVNRIQMHHQNEDKLIINDNSRELRCRTMIFDTDRDSVDNISEDLWDRIIQPMHKCTVEDNYTDAKILIY